MFRTPNIKLLRRLHVFVAGPGSLHPKGWTMAFGSVVGQKGSLLPLLCQYPDQPQLPDFFRSSFNPNGGRYPGQKQRAFLKI